MSGGNTGAVDSSGWVSLGFATWDESTDETRISRDGWTRDRTQRGRMRARDRRTASMDARTEDTCGWNGRSVRSASAGARWNATKGSTSTRAKESHVFISNAVLRETKPSTNSHRNVRLHVLAPQGVSAPPVALVALRTNVQHNETNVCTHLPVLGFDTHAARPLTSACGCACCVVPPSLAPSASYVRTRARARRRAMRAVVEDEATVRARTMAHVQTLLRRERTC